MCQQDKKSPGVETFPPNDESLALSCRFKNSLQALEFAQRPLITTEKTVKWLNQVSKSINQVLKCASAGFETVPSLCQWQNTKKCLVGHLTDVFSYLTFCLSTAGWKSSLLLRKLTSDQIPIPWTWHLGVPIAIIILSLSLMAKFCFIFVNFGTPPNHWVRQRVRKFAQGQHFAL